MQLPRSMPGAEPFFLPGGRIGCLLIHGFTGTPKEMRWMGEDLNQRGYTILAPRLAGHATQPGDLPRTRWQDWLASVEDGWNLLRSVSDIQFLAGLSLGGVLALIGASYLPAAGVISLSAPHHLQPDPRLKFARALGWLLPAVQKGEPDWHNPEAARDHAEYPAYPTRSIAELNDCLGYLRERLPLVKIPALVIHSRNDRGVLPDNAEAILAALGSADKQLYWVENSGHVIPREPDRHLAFQAAADFMKKAVAQH